jgi:hypothetical protein
VGTLLRGSMMVYLYRVVYCRLADARIPYMNCTASPSYTEICLDVIRNLQPFPGECPYKCQPDGLSDHQKGSPRWRNTTSIVLLLLAMLRLYREEPLLHQRFYLFFLPLLCQKVSPRARLQFHRSRHKSRSLHWRVWA